MSLAVTNRPTSAKYMLELFFKRDLSLIGLKEVDHDSETYYLLDKPTQDEIESLVPDGWELEYKQITEIQRHLDDLAEEANEYAAWDINWNSDDDWEGHA